MNGHSLDSVRQPFAAFLLASMIPAVLLAADLSKYRDIQFGTELPAVAKQTGSDPSQATLTHSRPALIQELTWRPQPLGWSPDGEAAQKVVFSFYNGQMFRAAVDYDRYAIEGLTADDLIEAISVGYGEASRPNAPTKATDGVYGDHQELLARWEDARFCFDLLRSSYGPSYKLVGVLKELDAKAQTAILEATRMDTREAPQRDAARVLVEGNAAKAKLEKARLANKAKFRP